VFESKELRRIFVPKREAAVRNWRKFHNDELHNLYLYQIKGMRCVGHVAWRDEKCIQNFGQKTWREETTWKTQV
jgi:hypothetical protein